MLLLLLFYQSYTYTHRPYFSRAKSRISNIHHLHPFQIFVVLTFTVIMQCRIEGIPRFYSIFFSGVGRCQKVGVGGGGGGVGAHRHVIYLPSVKNQYKRVVFGYMVIY